jgi:hypothetical protein
MRIAIPRCSISFIVNEKHLIGPSKSISSVFHHIVTPVTLKRTVVIMTLAYSVATVTLHYNVPKKK